MYFLAKRKHVRACGKENFGAMRFTQRPNSSSLKKAGFVYSSRLPKLFELEQRLDDETRVVVYIPEYENIYRIFVVYDNPNYAEVGRLSHEAKKNLRVFRNGLGRVSSTLILNFDKARHVSTGWFDDHGVTEFVMRSYQGRRNMSAVTKL